MAPNIGNDGVIAMQRQATAWLSAVAENKFMRPALQYTHSQKGIEVPNYLQVVKPILLSLKKIKNRSNMFTPKTIRVFSVVAITLSVVGLSLSIFLARQANAVFFLSIVSWALLLWASYIAFRLSSYKLYDDEYKKVGIRVYLIIIAFFLFIFVGLAAGLIVSVSLLSTLWGLKKNYDEWDQDDTAETTGPGDTSNS